MPLDRLAEDERLSLVLSYPKLDKSLVAKRLLELKALGVSSIKLLGDRRVYEVPVLGKGCVGIVVAVHRDRGEAVVKVRRTDSDRPSMLNEAEAMKAANRLGVGPRLLGATEDVILMQFIQGDLLPSWVKSLRGRGRRQRLRRVLVSILKQCLLLDQAGLDHGELSRAPKHIIIAPEDTPYILDFESSSRTRRPSNVTSVAQYLLIGSDLSRDIRRMLPSIRQEELLRALRAYKSKMDEESFKEVLEACSLLPSLGSKTSP